MADIIQRPFLLHEFNSTEVERGCPLLSFSSITSKDSLHVENRWLRTGLQAVERNHVALLVFSDQHRAECKNPSCFTFDTERKTCINGRGLRQALQQVNHLAQEGFRIPSSGLVQLIQRCIDEHDLALGRKIQHIIQTCRLNSDAFIGSHLIRMFGIFGCLEEAIAAFQTISQPTVFAWGALMSAHVHLGYSEQAIHLYTKMQESGVKPDGHIFVTVLKACMDIGNLERSLWIHYDIVKCGFETDVFVGSSLIHMYVNCGDLEKACQIFNKLPDRNVVTWSVLIDGHTQSGHSDKALALFEQMRAVGLEPNPTTYTSVVKACSQIQSGRQMHARIIEHGLELNSFVICTLINMYVKCASFADANIVFERLHKKDILPWNALITGLSKHGQDKDALHLFMQMQQEGIESNSSIYSCVLKACVNLGAFEQGFLIHSCMVENSVRLDVYTGSSLIDLYSKFGDLSSAEAVFHGLPEQNVVTWSALISGFLQHGYRKAGLHYFQQMKEEGVPPNEYTLVSVLNACSEPSLFEEGRKTHVTLIECGAELQTCVSNALIDMYVRCNHLQDAYKVFNKIPNRDVVSWSTLIAGSAELEDGEVALQHYAAMRHEGIEPNMVTFITLLRACSSIAALEHGRHLHAQVVNSGLSVDVYISSALIDMYSSCGCLQEAHMVFHRLNEYDAGVWSAMITGYVHHSNYHMAFYYFEAMQRSGLKPDSVSYLCILSACNRAGLVQEGQSHLKAMRDTHALLPSIEHLNCMVDLLGNANLLHEARDLLESIPFEYNIVGWVSLLSSCKRHTNVDVGRQCFDHIVTLDERNVTGYVLMANIYCSSGMQRAAENIDELRMIANGWKKPGKAFIEVNNKIHSFVVGDKNHPKSEAIYNKLKILQLQMHTGQAVTLCGSDSAPLPTEEDQLCGHCEKLALSFGLLYTAQGTTIRISKNLRMCSVCHKDTQFISKAEKREIIIVDACLVHHFRDGLCQCNMYDS